MKKIIIIMLAVVLTVLNLAGCGFEGREGEDSATLKIVTTIFPEYDWVRNILGEREDVELTLLLDNGADLHNYQPTAEDILKISSCNMFIYVGGESDEWVEDVLKEATNKNMVVVDLMEVLGDAVKEEEVVEGMQEEENEAGDEDEEEIEYDEHVWLSLRNAQTLIDFITQELERLDPSNAQEYRSNAEEYKGQLKELDEQYQEVVNGASAKTLVFGDRFPFRYFTDDYGLDYFAAFVGCSAETEASFETVIFLAEKVNELGLKSVMTIENSDQKIAKTIVENTKDKNQQILSMDSMQSVTANDVKSGTTYLSVMKKNLDVLKLALEQ